MSARHDFDLPLEDVEFLESMGYQWETVDSDGGKIVIIHNREIPAGYNVAQAEMMFKVQAYPEGKIDMVYFYPHLAIEGKRFPNVRTDRQVNGITWQEWSRHDAADQPWKSDYRIHHFDMMVQSWLQRELRR
jgi:hypothetical protein